MMSSPERTPEYDHLVSLKTFARELGISRTTLWRMGQRGEIQPPTTISRGRVGYPRSVLEELKKRQTV